MFGILGVLEIWVLLGLMIGYGTGFEIVDRDRGKGERRREMVGGRIYHDFDIHKCGSRCDIVKGGLYILVRRGRDYSSE